MTKNGALLLSLSHVSKKTAKKEEGKKVAVVLMMHRMISSVIF